jgi:Zn finger protein HypA/HybF involved in hydrogenase expression
MGDKNYFQCQSCGHIHREKVEFDIEDLYTSIICPRCRGETSHLWVGQKLDDLYMLYNPMVDPRFYNANNTK